MHCDCTYKAFNSCMLWSRTHEHLIVFSENLKQLEFLQVFLCFFLLCFCSFVQGLDSSHSQSMCMEQRLFFGWGMQQFWWSVSLYEHDLFDLLVFFLLFTKIVICEIKRLISHDQTRKNFNSLLKSCSSSLIFLNAL